MEKRMIFHIPYKLDYEAKAAPMLRPRKLISAFEELGYEVFVIDGYAKERKEKIRQVKKAMESGMKFEFLYSESSTMPTLLTDKNHLPLHPWVDFDFFRYVKRKGLKIGLFYRDIYWKFPEYKKNLSWLKSTMGILFYKYDLWQYAKYLSVFYMPTARTKAYIQNEKLRGIIGELGPGCDDIDSEKIQQMPTERIELFYVGGLGNTYRMHEFVKAVKEMPEVHLTICCREKEWLAVKDEYETGENIEIIHKSGAELEPYYLKATICSLMFEANEYRKLALPFKAFEYLANEKPVITSENTAISDFVQKNDIGWVVEYSKDAIKKQLLGIIQNPEQLKEKRDNCVKAKRENLWVVRAEKIRNDLS